MVLALYLTAMLVIMLISMAHGETSSTLAITAIGAVVAAAVSMALRRYTLNNFVRALKPTLNGHRLNAVAQISGLATPHAPLTWFCPFATRSSF